MKKVAIIGAGELGFFLAERLSAEQFNVVVVDKDRERLYNLQNALDVAVSPGDGANRKDLEKANIQGFDFLIAATGQDETNLITCLLGRELHVKKRIAVTHFLGSKNNPLPLNTELLGVDLVVNSSEAVKEEILDLMDTYGANELARFASGKLILLGRRLEEKNPWLGWPLGELLEEEEPQGFLMANVIRKHEVMGRDAGIMLEEGDYLYCFTTRERIPELLSLLQIKSVGQVRRALVYGDTPLARTLVEGFLGQGFSVTLLSSNSEQVIFFERMFQINEHFHAVEGNGMDAKLLKELLKDSDTFFIAVEPEDARNMTACMLAKGFGAVRAFAAIHRPELSAIALKVGVDANIAPRLASAKIIQKLIHGDKVLDYRAVFQANLEVIELQVHSKSRVLRHRIQKLRLPRGTMIGGLIRNDKALLATPDLQLQVGDEVLALTPPESLTELEAWFVV